MTRILWLDDQPDLLYEMAESLREDAIDVTLTWTDAQAIRHLEAEPLPDAFVQDLNRPVSNAQLGSLPPRIIPDSHHLSGWAFYRDVLVPALPQLPVILVTWDAEWPENRQTADDFNLKILRKGDHLRDDLVTAIAETVSAQRTILDAGFAPPGIFAPDFGKVNAALLRHLATHPDDLDRISWRGFEELIAVVLKELGYEVERTKLTRDGGVDLWALQRSDLGSTLYAIDAKRYSRTHVIGPEPVRAIYGVTNFENASAGMIVTTASFGPAARQLAKQYRYRVSLKDCEDVLAWIRRVNRS